MVLSSLDVAIIADLSWLSRGKMFWGFDQITGRSKDCSLLRIAIPMSSLVSDTHLLCCESHNCANNQALVSVRGQSHLIANVQILTKYVLHYPVLLEISN
jgi:hypothetical protein